MCVFCCCPALQIGDWGRQGNGDQKKAAQLMAAVGKCMPPKFIVSTGDNFYDSGLKSASDPNFKQSFTQVYTDASLQASKHVRGQQPGVKQRLKCSSICMRLTHGVECASSGILSLEQGPTCLTIDAPVAPVTVCQTAHAGAVVRGARES